MTWKYIGRGSFIAGVECRDYADEEFAAADARYSTLNNFPEGSLAASLLWEHQDDKPEKAKPATSEGE